MASLFTATMDVSPLKKALADVKKEIRAELDRQLKESSDQIAANARANCTIPSIAATIRTEKDGDVYTVTAGQGLNDPEIAAYHEFGTGDFARATVSGLPGDWIEYAWTFKKENDGHLPASPYLYKAFYGEVTKYINQKNL